jgi:hypothetical protein
MGEARNHSDLLSHAYSTLNRSVHNSRIERLWYDVSEGFGRKWKEFFHILEDHHGLNPLDPSHIWLLHLLFLPAINLDALAWAEAWNSHKIQLDEGRRSSPKQLFSRSLWTDGLHGLPPQDDHHEDYSLYGVDWDGIDQRQEILHDEGNYNEPDWVNNVVCDPPHCPLTDERVDGLMEQLAACVDIDSKTMDGRRVVWVQALELFLRLAHDQETN